ncbi:DNA-binding protein [Dickeya solani]|uniref:DNA-binding protein n=2 Tax=Dickeya solani TaxID=1089444 RepID=A0ABU4EKJ6_9GAMM|nr:DNA-binding protein [Dickeya solani]ANE77799.1 Cro/Cl family transcriptional regulator [Dickeya solani IPO 2222]AUH10848.1 Cro/Cl family transcriptional regulator [Dickeya solani D s0432-1]AUH14831.1 Cro/Cl family transcriptional regulator [Dickeya solani]MBJ2332731.1 putative DNA-binding transcriptional regulator [Dickeya solani]MBJ2339824.1 putative DNA-binding transcriptional regulator [Dickeya solani]
MEKAWFTTNELLGVAGLPRSRQGLNKRAKEHGWEKRRRKGIQGKGVEYAIWSLPEEVKTSLMQETPPNYAYAGKSATVQESTWIQIYHQLSVEERTRLIGHILREGAMGMLARLENGPQEYNNKRE